MIKFLGLGIGPRQALYTHKQHNVDLVQCSNIPAIGQSKIIFYTDRTVVDISLTFCFCFCILSLMLCSNSDLHTT